MDIVVILARGKKISYLLFLYIFLMMGCIGVRIPQLEWYEKNSVTLRQYGPDGRLSGTTIVRGDVTEYYDKYGELLITTKE